MLIQHAEHTTQYILWAYLQKVSGRITDSAPWIVLYIQDACLSVPDTKSAVDHDEQRT